MRTRAPQPPQWIARLIVGYDGGVTDVSRERKHATQHIASVMVKNEMALLVLKCHKHSDLRSVVADMQLYAIRFLDPMRFGSQ